MSRPSLIGPNDDNIMSCVINSASQEPGARFLVTWFSNNTIVADDVLDQYERRSELSLFSLTDTATVGDTYGGSKGGGGVVLAD